ncbi:hypothetical protein STXM2123_1387 [Streptomyces sp. F-3]|jgi:hypothetical protein|nr:MULTISPECIES: hypothetical protein [Streptomyces]MDN5383152.1 hypothetical protein [Streptomyces sp. LB8]GAT80686.1 hypothetical protein STXM2123_1387 [Streptomyces sp. F-3]
MEAWEDSDCPRCRSLLGPVRGPAAPHGGGRHRPHDGTRPTWGERAHLFMLCLAALTVTAALLAVLV